MFRLLQAGEGEREGLSLCPSHFLCYTRVWLRLKFFSRGWRVAMVIGTSALRSFCHSTQAKRNKLADGIPLCETMHYKVLLADSICNQDGMGVAAALAKATEDQSVVMN